jgi:hypothetical protein
LGKKAKESALPTLRPYFNQAITSGLPLDLIFQPEEIQTLVSGDVGSVAAPAAQAAPSGVRKVKNGVIYEQQPDGRYLRVSP